MSQGVMLMGQRGRQSLSREMTGWVDRVLGRDYHRYVPEESWSPAVNLYEDDCQYMMVVDLAGVRIQEIDLGVEDDVLVLTGRRDPPGLPEGSGGRSVHLMEIDHGKFTRKFELPPSVNVDAIEASYRCGYLWIRMPKKA